MTQYLLKIIQTVSMCCLLNPLFAQLIIQEGDDGFCSTDGVIANSDNAQGYTGVGYLDYVTYARWSFNVPTSGIYTITWMYALGGGNTDSRDAQVLLNDIAVIDTIIFSHTGDWATYAETSIQVELESGQNDIRIRSFVTPYLPHIDFFKISEAGVSDASCIDRYSLSLSTNNTEGGTISYDPVQEYYLSGTEITLTATPNPGYFFQSWDGNDASEKQVYPLKINKKTRLKAMFYPEGTTPVEDVIGYATIQNDKGTPYLLIGGSLGDTVLATSINDLKNLSASTEPKVITINKKIKGSGTLNISSDKTLLGITNSAHIEGVRIKINAASNVILKNLTFSKNTETMLEIQGASEQIWIDHCEFFNDLEHDKGHYGNLLQINDASSFITVSWSKFHSNKEGAIVISSEYDQERDTVVRVTFHHNYFFNNGSQVPSLRFGKAHIFNNYYYKNFRGIETRQGACMRIEKNLFEKNYGELLTVYDGDYNLVENVGLDTTFSTCELNVPYEYQSILSTDPGALKELLFSDQASLSNPVFSDRILLYPNPVSDKLYVNWKRTNAKVFDFALVSLSGQMIVAGEIKRGQSLDLKSVNSGIYILRLSTDNAYHVEKIWVNHE